MKLHKTLSGGDYVVDLKTKETEVELLCHLDVEYPQDLHCGYQ